MILARLFAPLGALSLSLSLSVSLSLSLLLSLPALAEVKVQQVTSPGGVRAWLVQDPSLPFVSIVLRFAGGQSLDPADRRGAVNLMTSLIEEGTGDLDSPGFAKARDSLAAQMEFDSDSDGVTVRLQTLSENRDASVDLLARALAAPRFDAPSIERVKGQVFANLRAREQDPAELVWQDAAEAVFGGHPYGASGDGTMESVAALGREDILQAHRRALTRDRVTIGASGDITPQALGLAIDRILRDLPTGEAALPGPAGQSFDGKVHVRDFPGPQSTVLFAHACLPVEDPDFLAASLLNEIIGGRRFSARLMTELREKRGLTYGVSTRISSWDQAAWISGSFQASNDKVAEAIALVRAQWARMAQEPISPEEIARAKAYMAGSYPLRWDGNLSIASILVGMQEGGFAADYPQQRNARLMALTEAEIARVAQRLFDPAALTFFVVGQPQGLAGD